MKNLGPRRKRMKRRHRLQLAKQWIPTYTGKNIIHGYRKWFGVDYRGAILELRTLGVKLDEQYVTHLLENIEQKIIAKKRKLNKKKEEEDLLEDWGDSDENFYYIAGYTNWGFPYGLTWAEAEEQGLLEPEDPQTFSSCRYAIR